MKINVKLHSVKNENEKNETTTHSLHLWWPMRGNIILQREFGIHHVFKYKYIVYKWRLLKEIGLLFSKHFNFNNDP